MKTFALIAVAAALGLSATSTSAQFIEGNEAVTLMPDGSKHVETPPLPPSNVLAAPCPASRAGCMGGVWHMVETAQGLQECTEINARATTCRASIYGSEQRSRLWIVKSRSQWLQCQYPELASKCVSTRALPFSAVQ